jgi:hypothetical protein
VQLTRFPTTSSHTIIHCLPVVLLVLEEREKRKRK